MTKVTIFYYIDALNSYFINPDTMPFLYNLENEHYYKCLENVIGYSFAIQSCLLSGKYPEESNQWMPYFYSYEQSPPLFKFLKKFISKTRIDKISPKIYNLMMILIRRKILKKGVHINNIPLNIINSISLYPYYYLCELPAFRELENILKNNYQTSLSYIGPPKIKKDVYGSLLKHIIKNKKEKELIIIYEDELDRLGHKYGPSSIEYLNSAKRVDKSLSKIYRKLKDIYKCDFNFLVFSDHGQCDQLYEVDILSILKSKELTLSKDYICFIDATVASFWPKNEITKEKILNILHKIKLGKVIDENKIKKYYINFKDNRYGEIFYVLKPNVIFFPNFYSGTGSMKGLHGYTPDDKVQEAFLISNKNIPHSVQHVKDIRKILLNLVANYE